MGTTFLISSLFIVLSSVIQSKAIASSHESQHHQPVLDTDGNEIQAGQPYYIHGSEMNFGMPISFSLASASMEGRIVSLPKERAIGRMLLGVRTPSSSRARTILESTNVNIRFSEMPVVWQVQESQGSCSPNTRRYVTIGGQQGHPSSPTVRNEYGIAYCLSVCESCEVMRRNVGISSESGRKWLSVSEHREFPFVFIKAKQN
uniref:Miraculin-like n=1 Tax=Nelumbo nucifera TaxID=4432 RepID=A0A822Z316_NELNU|nr:TPA_asm: hypothetical protein HUJ06_013735 [Nelumbo nucifera]